MKILSIVLVAFGVWCFANGLLASVNGTSAIHQIYETENYILGVLWFILAKMCYTSS